MKLIRFGDWLAINSVSAPRVPTSVRLGPPICRSSKIVGIGLKFRDHGAETGATIPKEPVIFFKSTTALVGPNDDLVIPKNATQVDWEVEFAIVIGRRWVKGKSCDTFAPFGPFVANER